MKEFKVKADLKWLYYTSCEVFKLVTRDRREILLIARKSSLKASVSQKHLKPMNLQLVVLSQSNLYQELAYVLALVTL